MAFIDLIIKLTSSNICKCKSSQKTIYTQLLILLNLPNGRLFIDN